MREEKVTTTLLIYEHLEELSQADKELMEAAVTARKNAYAPYSNFQVGAAVRLANGKTVIGNNQENASYPSGLCAERVAIFQAGALYPNTVIESIAISATSKNYVVKDLKKEKNLHFLYILKVEDHLPLPVNANNYIPFFSKTVQPWFMSMRPISMF